MLIQLNLTIDIEFTPKTNKNYSAVLKIKSNSNTGALQDVQLYGVGFGVTPKPKIYCEVNNLDFGETADSLNKTIEISNIGTASLKLENIIIEFDEDKVFSIDAKLPINIEPSGKFSLRVWFKPKYNNIFGALMKIISDDATNSEHKVNLVGVGEGVKTYAVLVIDFKSLDFGKVHSSKTMTISLTNTGYKTLEFEDFAISGDDAQYFSITGKKPIKLFNNDTQNLYIKFEPKADRQFNAELNIKSNADNSSIVSIPLVGIGEGWSSVYQLESNEYIELMVSPNPTSSDIIVRFNIKDKNINSAKFELVNLIGTTQRSIEIQNVNYGENIISISLAGIPPGAYFIVANIQDAKVFKPIIIIN